MRPEQESRPACEIRAARELDGDETSSSPSSLADPAVATPEYHAGRARLVASHQRRCIQEALTTASVWYWQRRATTFAAVGNARCDEIAQACRNRAAFLERHGLDQHQLAADLWSVAWFGEVA